MTRKTAGIYLGTALLVAFLAIFVGPTQVLPAPVAVAAYAGRISFVALHEAEEARQRVELSPIWGPATEKLVHLLTARKGQ